MKVKKKDYVDNMISTFETCRKSDIAKVSAAEQLIKLFEGMTDVSFVYVKYHIESGFVTYTKDKGSRTNVTRLTDA